MTIRRKALLGALILIAGILLFGIGMHYRAKSRWYDYKQTLAARGEKVSVHDAIPIVPTGQNGMTDFMLATGGTNLDSVPGLWELSPMKAILPGKARVLWKETVPVEYSHIGSFPWERIASALKLRVEELAAVRRAMQSETLFYHLPYHQGMMMRLPHLSKLRLVQQWLMLDTVRALHEQRPEEALESLKHVIAVPQKFNVEPLLISQFVRSQMIADAAGTTWEALQFDGWTDSQLSQLQDEWMKLEVASGLEAAVAMERGIVFELIDEARASRKVVDDLEQILNGAGRPLPINSQPRWRILARRHIGYWTWREWRSYDEQIYLGQFWQVLLDALRQARTDKSYAAALTSPQLRDDLEEAADDSRFYLSQLFFELTNLSRGTRRSQVIRLAGAETIRELAVTATALKRYQLKHGVPASSLEDLVPDFLAQMPTDYFDGQPLRYKARPAGLILYSVGKNVQDDGGDGTPEQIDQPTFYDGLDIVWPHPATRDEIQASEKSAVNTPQK